jgi:hypothetical protein
LYVWGRLLYLDAFNDPHHLNFCFTVNGDTLTKGFINYCRDDNDADR